MSGWGLGWFGGAKKTESPKSAILDLRSQLEMLSKREKHLQTQADEQDALARRYVSTNKNGKYVRPILRWRSKTCSLWWWELGYRLEHYC